MGVRVQIEIKSNLSHVTARTAALLNSGYESETPELLLPAGLAQVLNMFPSLPAAAESVSYETAGGITRMYRIENALQVRVSVHDRQTQFITCGAVISELEREAILSDAALEAFGVLVVSPRSGKWRFLDETSLRDSVPRKTW